MNRFRILKLLRWLFLSARCKYSPHPLSAGSPTLTLDSNHFARRTPYWPGSSRCTPLPLTLLSGSTRPPASTRCRSSRRGAPDLAGCPVIVNLSPSLKVSLLKPASDRLCGLPSSAPQWTTSPLSSVTSNRRPQWGLAQNHSVTVPVSVTSLSLTYATPVPWCANIGALPVTKPTTKAKDVTNFTFTPHLHAELGRSFRFEPLVCKSYAFPVFDAIRSTSRYCPCYIMSKYKPAIRPPSLAESECKEAIPRGDGD